MTGTLAAAVVIAALVAFTALLTWERHKTPRAPEDGRCPPTHGA